MKHTTGSIIKHALYKNDKIYSEIVNDLNERKLIMCLFWDNKIKGFYSHIIKTVEAMI